MVTDSIHNEHIVELEPHRGNEATLESLATAGRLGALALVGSGAAIVAADNQYGLFMIGTGAGFYAAHRVYYRYLRDMQQ